MNKLKRGTLKWLAGVCVNLMGCCLVFLIVKFGMGWNFMDALMIGGFIQMVLMVPTYIREINIQPQGPPATLKGMSRYDVNDFPQFIGIKRMVEADDLKPLKTVSGYKWFFLRRTIFQKLSYVIIMIGTSLTYYLVTY